MFACINYTPFLKIGNSYYNKSNQIFILRNGFQKIPTKLDSLEYHQLAGTGSPGSAVFINCKIGSKYYKLHENLEQIVSEIENNGYSTQVVWYNKDFKKVFLKKKNEEQFPWFLILFKNIIAIILSLATPSILAYYILKNTIKLIILIYKKEYYNVEDTEDK